MLPNRLTFHRQQLREAVVSLLSHDTIEEAALDIGMDKSILYRWLKRPAFGSELRQCTSDNPGAC